MPKCFEAYAYSICFDSLFQENFTASVDMIFGTSFQLCTSGGVLIHISSGNYGISPFSVCISEDDFIRIMDHIMLGQQVSFSRKSRCLMFASGVAISLLHGQKYNGKLSQTSNSEILFQNKEFILPYLQSQDTAVSMGISLSWLEQNQDILLAAITGQTKNANPVLDMWIGRGQGLTPSCDDIMIGIMAAACFIGQDYRLGALHRYIIECGSKRTTSVSYAYLSYAVCGYFSSIVLTFLHTMSTVSSQSEVTRALQQVARHGHTSGCDLLYGIALGLSSSFSDNTL